MPKKPLFPKKKQHKPVFGTTLSNSAHAVLRATWSRLSTTFHPLTLSTPLKVSGGKVVERRLYVERRTAWAVKSGQLESVVSKTVFLLCFLEIKFFLQKKNVILNLKVWKDFKKVKPVWEKKLVATNKLFCNSPLQNTNHTQIHPTFLFLTFFKLVLFLGSLANPPHSLQSPSVYLTIPWKKAFLLFQTKFPWTKNLVWRKKQAVFFGGKTKKCQLWAWVNPWVHEGIKYTCHFQMTAPFVNSIRNEVN